jgi:hypothetical protein
MVAAEQFAHNTPAKESVRSGDEKSHLRPLFIITTAYDLLEPVGS